MPRLTYTPEGADPKVWDFSFGRLLSPERIAIEKLTGLGWAGVQQGYWQNHGTVIHAMLFVLLKREIPTLRAEELVFCDDEIEIDVTDEEAAEALEKLRSLPDPSEDEVAALAELQVRFADAEDSDPKEG